MTTRFEEISSCRGCGASTALDPVFKMDPMPLAGLFCDSVEEALRAEVYPLSWVRCGSCALVQVLQDIPDKTLFAKYNYASSSVPGLVRHFDSFAAHLRLKYERCVLLEIGCNDGVLLGKLPSSWKLTGVDPSDVAARASVAQQYTFYNEPFSSAFVREHRLEGVYDVVTGSNCLAHISNLKDVFDGAWLALREGGHFWIEVHDLDVLLEQAQWDTIYHEHKAEWSEESLCNCLAGAGFHPVSLERLPLHAGLIRACFRKVGRKENYLPVSPISSKFAQLREAYERRYDNSAVKTVQEASRRGLIAAYGASGRANVFLNHLLAARFSYIVDEAPLRRGKFLPRVGTPIAGPEFLEYPGASHCLITAWNYKADIVRKNKTFKGEWLTAF